MTDNAAGYAADCQEIMPAHGFGFLAGDILQIAHEYDALLRSGDIDEP